MSIRTILFDLDGTLINTNELIIASFTHTLEKHTGRTYTREEILPFIGPPLDESMRHVDESQAEAMVQTYREHNIANHKKYVVAYPTVVETVKTLKEKGYQLGIVTTKIRETAELGVKITGMEGMFDVIIGLDDVTNAKPHPEPIIKALTELNANPMHALMVGDNYHDIESGHNAGVKTAGVAWSIKGEATLAKYEPDYMLKEMKDLLPILEV
ncbi:pyrophosphatase PpaX [Paraliobacillus ryukyuensis]|uniref:Pyrophosphatase PpaX n=1 Tax=Paraliobacillus ryukyuensis TaxID=200904 RepID=A0A366E6R0_9BACI|nr:pyrophosphatase PpaX [Paraliobacillus ryukyuensis]RBO98002.1 pyrophosphatase PpaX [Paraliobacillus ryukyuensis]